MSRSVDKMRPFSARLKEAAEHVGLEFGQTAIARSLGVNKQTVDRWFNDGIPKPDHLYLIEDKWNVSARWLAREEGPMVLDRIRHSETLTAIPPGLREKVLGAIRTFLNNDKEGQEEILNAVQAIGDARARGRKRRP